MGEEDQDGSEQPLGGCDRTLGSRGAIAITAEPGSHHTHWGGQGGRGPAPDSRGASKGLSPGCAKMAMPSGHLEMGVPKVALGNWEGRRVGQGKDVPSDEMPPASELPSSQNGQVRERKKVVS